MLAIISDTHDNLANLARFLLVAKELDITEIIHCGDVTTPETLDWLAENFSGPIKLTCGNSEINRSDFNPIVRKHPNLEVFSEIGEWKISRSARPELSRVDLDNSGLIIAFVHRPDKVKELATTERYNFVFYGHTHKPWIEQFGRTIVANPGTLGGVFTYPTFAILDVKTGRLELKKLY